MRWGIQTQMDRDNAVDGRLVVDTGVPVHCQIRLGMVCVTWVALQPCCKTKPKT